MSGPRTSSARERERERPAVDAERLMRTCPICAAELEERKCKLFCSRPGCGYYLSCADYY